MSAVDVEIAAETPGVPIPGQTKTEARLEKGWGHDFEGRALFWIAVAFSAFQIVPPRSARCRARSCARCMLAC